jgi:hypothetical protein
MRGLALEPVGPHHGAMPLRTAVPVLVLLAACAPPKRDYSVEQIQGVETLSELMWVQATVADPLMRQAKRLTPDKLTDELYAKYFDMGVRLRATTARMPAFNEAEGFKKLSDQMLEQSVKLAEYAKAKQAKGTIDTARAIEQTCTACHDEYR